MAFNPFQNQMTPQWGETPAGSMPPTGATMFRQQQLAQRRGEMDNSFQGMLDAITRMLGGGAGGGGLPKRSDLLDPRLGDITEMFGGARNKMMNQFASMGRDVTGSVPQERMAALGSREALERQRAMGDVDTLLAQLGIQQSAQLPQLLSAMMQLFGGMFK